MLALARDSARLAARIATLAVGLALAVGNVVACSVPSASFTASGPCTVDGAAPGAYPDLEARIPATYRSTAPGLLDSGRNCSDTSLGSLADAGVAEIRFAGGTWTFGGERALVLAVFTAPGLDADEVAEFYAASARDATRTEVLAESAPTIAGRAGRRLDTRTGERLQTVVVWPAADTDVVNVVISNDLPDERIDEAVAAFGDG